MKGNPLNVQRLELGLGSLLALLVSYAHTRNPYMFSVPSFFLQSLQVFVAPDTLLTLMYPPSPGGCSDPLSRAAGFVYSSGSFSRTSSFRSSINSRQDPGN